MLSCRYLYFLQLKHLILNGELHCSNDLAVKLASYALQGMLCVGWTLVPICMYHSPLYLIVVYLSPLPVAEFGDFDPDKHDDEFLNDYIFLPPVSQRAAS